MHQAQNSRIIQALNCAVMKTVCTYTTELLVNYTKTSQWQQHKNLPGLMWTCSEVKGEPFNDPCGRWKLGGGINVPVRLTIVTKGLKAVELKRALGQMNFHVEIQ